MKTRIVRIGNSQGIRIPKPLIEQTGLQGEVEISVEGDSLIIRPMAKMRSGWETAFREMAEHGDDVLIGGDTPSTTTWDKDEWQW